MSLHLPLLTSHSFLHKHTINSEDQHHHHHHHQHHHSHHHLHNLNEYINSDKQQKQRISVDSSLSYTFYDGSTLYHSDHKCVELFDTDNVCSCSIESSPLFALEAKRRRQQQQQQLNSCLKCASQVHQSTTNRTNLLESVQRDNMWNELATSAYERDLRLNYGVIDSTHPTTQLESNYANSLEMEELLERIVPNGSNMIHSYGESNMSNVDTPTSHNGAAFYYSPSTNGAGSSSGSNGGNSTPHHVMSAPNSVISGHYGSSSASSPYGQQPHSITSSVSSSSMTPPSAKSGQSSTNTTTTIQRPNQTSTPVNYGGIYCDNITGSPVTSPMSIHQLPRCHSNSSAAATAAVINSNPNTPYGTNGPMTPGAPVISTNGPMTPGSMAQPMTPNGGNPCTPIQLKREESISSCGSPYPSNSSDYAMFTNGSNTKRMGQQQQQQQQQGGSPASNGSLKRSPSVEPASPYNTRLGSSSMGPSPVNIVNRNTSSSPASASGPGTPYMANQSYSAPIGAGNGVGGNGYLTPYHQPQYPPSVSASYGMDSSIYDSEADIDDSDIFEDADEENEQFKRLSNNDPTIYATNHVALLQDQLRSLEANTDCHDRYVRRQKMQEARNDLQALLQINHFDDGSFVSNPSLSSYVDSSAYDIGSGDESHHCQQQRQQQQQQRQTTKMINPLNGQFSPIFQHHQQRQQANHHLTSSHEYASIQQQQQQQQQANGHGCSSFNHYNHYQQAHHQSHSQSQFSPSNSSTNGVIQSVPNYHMQNGNGNSIYGVSDQSPNIHHRTSLQSYPNTFKSINGSLGATNHDISLRSPPTNTSHPYGVMASNHHSKNVQFINDQLDPVSSALLTKSATTGNVIESVSFDPKTGMMKIKKKRGRPRKNPLPPPPLPPPISLQSLTNVSDRSRTFSGGQKSPGAFSSGSSSLMSSSSSSSSINGFGSSRIVNDDLNDDHFKSNGKNDSYGFHFMDQSHSNSYNHVSSQQSTSQSQSKLNSVSNQTQSSVQSQSQSQLVASSQPTQHTTSSSSSSSRPSSSSSSSQSHPYGQNGHPSRDSAPIPPVKRPRGRPRNNDPNRPTPKPKSTPSIAAILPTLPGQPVMKRGRGRPKALKTLMKEAEALIADCQAKGNDVPDELITFVSEGRAQLAKQQMQQSQQTNLSQQHHKTNMNRASLAASMITGTTNNCFNGQVPSSPQHHPMLPQRPSSIQQSTTRPKPISYEEVYEYNTDPYRPNNATSVIRHSTSTMMNQMSMSTNTSNQKMHDSSSSSTPLRRVISSELISSSDSLSSSDSSDDDDDDDDETNESPKNIIEVNRTKLAPISTLTHLPPLKAQPNPAIMPSNIIKKEEMTSDSSEDESPFSISSNDDEETSSSSNDDEQDDEDDEDAVNDLDDSKSSSSSSSPTTNGNANKRRESRGSNNNTRPSSNNSPNGSKTSHASISINKGPIFTRMGPNSRPSMFIRRSPSASMGKPTFSKRFISAKKINYHQTVSDEDEYDDEDEEEEEEEDDNADDKEMRGKGTSLNRMKPNRTCYNNNNEQVKQPKLPKLVLKLTGNSGNSTVEQQQQQQQNQLQLHKQQALSNYCVSIKNEPNECKNVINNRTAYASEVTNAGSTNAPSTAISCTARLASSDSPKIRLKVTKTETAFVCSQIISEPTSAAATTTITTTTNNNNNNNKHESIDCVVRDLVTHLCDMVSTTVPNENVSIDKKHDNYLSLEKSLIKTENDLISEDVSAVRNLELQLAGSDTLFRKPITPPIKLPSYHLHEPFIEAKLDACDVSVDEQSSAINSIMNFDDFETNHSDIKLIKSQDLCMVNSTLHDKFLPKVQFDSIEDDLLPSLQLIRSPTLSPPPLSSPPPLPPSTTLPPPPPMEQDDFLDHIISQPSTGEEEILKKDLERQLEASTCQSLTTNQPDVIPLGDIIPTVLSDSTSTDLALLDNLIEENVECYNKVKQPDIGPLFDIVNPSEQFQTMTHHCPPMVSTNPSHLVPNIPVGVADNRPQPMLPNRANNIYYMMAPHSHPSSVQSHYPPQQIVQLQSFVPSNEEYQSKILPPFQQSNRNAAFRPYPSQSNVYRSSLDRSYPINHSMIYPDGNVYPNRPMQPTLNIVPDMAPHGQYARCSPFSRPYPQQLPQQHLQQQQQQQQQQQSYIRPYLFQHQSQPSLYGHQPTVVSAQPVQSMGYHTMSPLREFNRTSNHLIMDRNKTQLSPHVINPNRPVPGVAFLGPVPPQFQPIPAPISSNSSPNLSQLLSSNNPTKVFLEAKQPTLIRDKLEEKLRNVSSFGSNEMLKDLLSEMADPKHPNTDISNTLKAKLCSSSQVDVDLTLDDIFNDSFTTDPSNLEEELRQLQELDVISNTTSTSSVSPDSTSVTQEKSMLNHSLLDDHNSNVNNAEIMDLLHDMTDYVVDCENLNKNQIDDDILLVVRRMINQVAKGIEITNKLDMLNHKDEHIDVVLVNDIVELACHDNIDDLTKLDTIADAEITQLFKGGSKGEKLRSKRRRSWEVLVDMNESSTNDQNVNNCRSRSNSIQLKSKVSITESCSSPVTSVTSPESSTWSPMVRSTTQTPPIFTPTEQSGVNNRKRQFEESNKVDCYQKSTNKSKFKMDENNYRPIVPYEDDDDESMSQNDLKMATISNHVIKSNNGSLVIDIRHDSQQSPIPTKRTKLDYLPISSSSVFTKNENKDIEDGCIESSVQHPDISSSVDIDNQHKSTCCCNRNKVVPDDMNKCHLTCRNGVSSHSFIVKSTLNSTKNDNNNAKLIAQQSPVTIHHHSDSNGAIKTVSINFDAQNTTTIIHINSGSKSTTTTSDSIEKGLSTKMSEPIEAITNGTSSPNID